MKKFKEYLVPTITLCLICLVAGTLLALTNKITAPRIAEIDAQAAQEAMQKVLPDAVEFGENQKDEATGCTWAKALDTDGNVIGYAVTSVGKGGYSGDIKLMVGLSVDGKVSKFDFLAMDETPSIGMKLKTNNEFLAQLLGLSGSAKLKNNGGTVDAVTGATKTSQGITDAVNTALMCYENIKEVGTNE